MLTKYKKNLYSNLAVRQLSKYVKILGRSLIEQKLLFNRDTFSSAVKKYTSRF